MDLFRECESVVRKRRRDGAVPEADIRTPPEPQSFPGDHQIEDSAEWERNPWIRSRISLTTITAYRPQSTQVQVSYTVVLEQTEHGVKWKTSSSQRFRQDGSTLVSKEPVGMWPAVDCQWRYRHGASERRPHSSRCVGHHESTGDARRSGENFTSSGTCWDLSSIIRL